MLQPGFYKQRYQLCHKSGGSFKGIPDGWKYLLRQWECREKNRAYSVGRANWLFADTVAGAEINAAMYSIVETAKANGVNIMIYLRYLLEQMPRHLSDTGRDYLADMVPWYAAYKNYEEEYIASRRCLCQNLFTEPSKLKTPAKTEMNEKASISTSA